MNTGYNYRIESKTLTGWRYTGYNVPVGDVYDATAACRRARQSMKNSGEDTAGLKLRAIREGGDR